VKRNEGKGSQTQYDTQLAEKGRSRTTKVARSVKDTLSVVNGRFVGTHDADERRGEQR